MFFRASSTLEIACSNTYHRRLIGRRYEDTTVKKDVESWPFKVVDQGGNPVVEVGYLGENKTFTPQEISSMVLMKVIFPALAFYTPPVWTCRTDPWTDERSCRD